MTMGGAYFNGRFVREAVSIRTVPMPCSAQNAADWHTTGRTVPARGTSGVLSAGTTSHAICGRISKGRRTQGDACWFLNEP